MTLEVNVFGFCPDGGVSLFATFRSDTVFLLQYVLLDEVLKNILLALLVTQDKC